MGKLNIKFFIFLVLCTMGSVFSYTALMLYNGWTLNANASGISSFNTSKSISIYLYKSPSAVAYFSGAGGDYERLIAPWIKFSDSFDLKVDLIETLKDIKPSIGRVLVLPSAVALSDSEKQAILGFRDAGGNVFVTWATGSRNESGDWIGWDFFKQLTDAEVVAELELEKGPRLLVTKGESPLTHNMDAGTPVPLGETAEKPIVLKTANIAANSGTIVFPWKTLDRPVGLLSFQEFSDNNDSRVVAFGVAETSWEYSQDTMQQMIYGAMSWLTRQPVVIKAHWPAAKSSAYMLAVDSSGSLGKEKELSELLQTSTYGASFFVPSAVMVKSSAIANEIALVSDVAYLGDGDVGFKGQSLEQQKDRIQQMIQKAESFRSENQKGLIGFQAPDFSADENTDQALYDNGIRYHLSKRGDNQARLPAFGIVKNEVAGERFVVLPVHDSDVYDLKKVNSLDGVSFADDAVELFESVRSLAAFGSLVLNLQGQEWNDFDVGRVRSVIEHIKSKSKENWLSNGQGIARWWRERDNFIVKTRPSGARIEIDVSNVSSGPMIEPALIVMLPEKQALPAIEGLKPSSPIPVVIRLDNFRAAIVFSSLPVGSFSYQVTF